MGRTDLALCLPSPGGRGEPGPSRATIRGPCHIAAAMLGPWVRWTSARCSGWDFETTGIDRFDDVPVSYALVSVVDGRGGAQLVGV